MAVVTDTIADMLTRIRNANQMRYEEVRVPSSKIKIKPTKTNQGNFYTKAEAKQIVRYICDGYRKWGTNHKSGKRTKTNPNKGEQYTISWQQAYQIAENKLLQLSDRVIELENENAELKEKLEKKRKFWFFK